MRLEDFAYIVNTQKSFDEAAVSVLSAVEKKGWMVFNVIGINERLAAKGFEQKPLKIIEICNGKHANHFLNKSRFVSLFMPCRINILEEDGKVKIASMRPATMSQFFPEVDREEAEAVEKDVIGIIDSAK
ncbi:MAG: DUF302 domain-containing protein [Actinobacteria bacterium]|nr:DUF302 domain-containing protein [Actinomycetota bacterium]